MNVSESIDWRHSTPGELDLHRFIGTHEERPNTGRLSLLLHTERPVDTQHRTLPLHQRAQGDKMKEITLITTDFYISVLGGTR